MSRDRLELRLLRRLERLPVLPAVLGRGDDPEVPFGALDDPLLTGPIHVDGRHLLPESQHHSLLQSLDRNRTVRRSLFSTSTCHSATAGVARTGRLYGPCDLCHLAW